MHQKSRRERVNEAGLNRCSVRRQARMSTSLRASQAVASTVLGQHDSITPRLNTNAWLTGVEGLAGHHAVSGGGCSCFPSCTKLSESERSTTIPPRRSNHTNRQTDHSNTRWSIVTGRTYCDGVWSYRISWSIHCEPTSTTRMSGRYPI